MKWEEIDSQLCSVAQTLSVVGDRWTLLIIRDIFMRVRRFSQLQDSLGISRHRLSDRLSKLLEAGVLEKHLYDERFNRYEYRLTEKGLDLYSLLIVMVQWGDKWEGDSDGAPLVYRHKTCKKVMQPRFCCDQCGEPLDARHIETCLGPGIKAKLARNELVDIPKTMEHLFETEKRSED